MAQNKAYPGSVKKRGKSWRVRVTVDRDPSAVVVGGGLQAQRRALHHPGTGLFILGNIGVIAVERWFAGIEHPGARLAAYKTLRQGLRQARRWKLLTEVVADAVEPPKVPHYEAKVIDAKQAARLLSAFRGHQAEAGVHWVTLKNLRHSHAAIMLESSVGVVAASRRLGHSSVSITDRFYLRLTRAVDARRRRLRCPRNLPSIALK